MVSPTLHLDHGELGQGLHVPVVRGGKPDTPLCKHYSSDLEIHVCGSLFQPATVVSKKFHQTADVEPATTVVGWNKDTYSTTENLPST